MREIKVVSHRSEWETAFLKEATVLKTLLGDVLLAVHHVGSTAIPGILAKPTIDLLGEAVSLEAVDSLSPIMATNGYLVRGEYGIPQRRYFVKGTPDKHTHHIHIFPAGHPEVIRHINFRDYLIAHPETAAAYSLLKEKLAQQFKYDSAGYTDGKSEFIQDVDRKAAAWKENSKLS